MTSLATGISVASILQFTPATVLQLLALPDGTAELVVSGGALTITVSGSQDHDGTYVVSVDDLAAGPVCLNPPQVSGSPAIGAALTVISGLWLHDTTIPAPTLSHAWTRNGIAIAGATGASYTVTPVDADTALAVVETAADASGTVPAASSTVDIPALPAGSGFVEDFEGYAEATLVSSLPDFVQAYTSSWEPVRISAGQAKIAETTFGTEYLTYTGTVAADQYAQITVDDVGSTPPDPLGTAYAFGRYTDENNWYAAEIRTVGSGTSLRYRKRIGGTYSTPFQTSFASGDTARIEVEGTEVRILRNGLVVHSSPNETDLAAGAPGLGINQSGGADDVIKIGAFECGDL